MLHFLDRRCAAIWACSTLLPEIMSPAMAGPPYLSDDPEPTDYRHVEIYAFSNGTAMRDGTDGEAGIDFNYGAAPNLQLTAVLPVGYGFPASGPSESSLSNIELAATWYGSLSPDARHTSWRSHKVRWNGRSLRSK